MGPREGRGGEMKDAKVDAGRMREAVGKDGVHEREKKRCGSGGRE